MIKILSIPFTLIAYIWFFIVILIMHPVQWIALNVFGYEAHKRSVDVIGLLLLGCLNIMLSYPKCYNRKLIPEGKPVIFVANHQSLFDIMGMSWYFRKFHPKFVSKIELGKGIPSVSFNLRHGGSVLIDRNDPKQALPLLKKMGEYIQKYNRSTIIYPEGTRTKDGKPKSFAPNGLKILCKYAPDAYVVPVTINNSWKMFRHGGFPLDMFVKVSFTVHEPILVRGTEFNALFEQTQQAIVAAVK